MTGLYERDANALSAMPFLCFFSQAAVGGNVSDRIGLAPWAAERQAQHH